MMLKSWLLVVALALTSPWLAAKPAMPAPPLPLLWQACDSDNCLYLLGSFHVLRADDYPLSADVEAAFARASSVVFEIAPAELASAELASKMMSAATQRGGRQLHDDLPPALNAKFDTWADTHQAALVEQGVAAPMLQLFKPWFAAIMVSLTSMQAMDMHAEHGLDRYLAQRALAAGKAVAGLESGDAQIAMLDGMQRDEQLQMLEEALDSAAAGSQHIIALHTAWRRGDADRLLEDSVNSMRDDYPRLYRVINVDRNRAWLPQLEARLQQPGRESSLVVVGAMHLLGGDGLLAMLERAGYRIERICTACAGR